MKVNGQVKKEQMSEDEHENENNNEKVNGTASEEKETKPEVCNLFKNILKLF